MLFFILCILMTVILLVTDYVAVFGGFETSNIDANNENEKSYGSGQGNRLSSYKKRYIISSYEK